MEQIKQDLENEYNKEAKRFEYFADLYKTNQAFIDKITITASLGSIPLSVGLINRFAGCCCFVKIIFIIANLCAIGVIVCQIVGAKYGKKTCDAVFEYRQKDAENNNRIQCLCNDWVNRLFIIMLILYVLIIVILVFNK